MRIFELVVLSCIALGLAGALARTRSPDVRAALTDKLGKRAGLTVPAQLRPMVEERVMQFRRREHVGYVIGLLIGWMVARTFDFSGGFVLVPHVAGTVGQAVGTGMALLSRQRPADPAGPQLTDPRDLRATDYVVTREVRAAWAAVGIILVALGTLYGLGQAAALPPVGFAEIGVSATLVGLSAVALVAWAELARQVIKQRDIVGSAAELAWHDAFKITKMRDNLAVASSLALYGILCAPLSFQYSEAWIDAYRSWPEPLAEYVVWGVVLALGALAGLGISRGIERGAERRLLAGLWPVLATPPARDESEMARRDPV